MRHQTIPIQAIHPTLDQVEQDSLEQPKRILLNNSGQASIEFILTIVFTLGMTLLFIALALNTTKGYVAHYVTFMTARTYLVHDDGNRTISSNTQPAINAANETFEQYGLGAFGIESSGLQIHSDSSKSNLFRGATLTFSQLLSPLSIIANGVNATFHSEALLGKEPLRAECYESICTELTGDSACDRDQLITVMDNGC